MRTLEIDLRNPPVMPIPAGYRGDRKITHLVLTPPDYLLDAAAFVAVFAYADITCPRRADKEQQVPCALADSSITVALPSAATRGGQCRMTLQGVYADGRMGQSAMLTLDLGEVAHGQTVVPGADVPTLAQQVALNTAARHTHANMPTLDKLGEDIRGAPTWESTPFAAPYRRITNQEINDMIFGGTI
ncbi:MAG: hypothetical protein LBN05_08830 [Oscillospiraceae bacterium]|jgi:hypothetical protein|nr:hypothetical protein [Oscillospiraceae bacterium]